jgi:hypothetical protein
LRHEDGDAHGEKGRSQKASSSRRAVAMAAAVGR